MVSNPPMEEHYAVVEGGFIVNVVVCNNPEYAAEQGWICLEGMDPLPWIGDQLSKKES